jgi:beta-glucosidase
MIINGWNRGGLSIDTARIYLEAGKLYSLKAEYWDNRDYAVAKLSWTIPATSERTRLEMYGEAGKAARSCDMTIAVLGVNKSIEREGKDRTSIEVPKDQEEFIREIYKVNPNTVVVLVAGSSLAINWINENIPAIINAWYPGEQGGTAVAEVLFGDYNPAGRLPLTYYHSLEEIAPFDDYDITKGRTYQYFKAKPLYPFGYGLSYTSFEYKNMAVIDKGASIALAFDLKNTGKTKGEEVVQLYVKLPAQENAIMPIKQLKGFKRVFLDKGKTQRVEIEVEKNELRYWDETKSAFVRPQGKYIFMLGASSEDIRLLKESEISINTQ